MVRGGDESAMNASESNPLVAYARQLIEAKRDEIARVQSIRAQHASAVGDLNAKIEELTREREQRESELSECAAAIASAERSLRELERSLAMLEERLTPETPSPERQRVHAELDRALRHTPESEPEPELIHAVVAVQPAAAPNRRRAVRDPLHVNTREGTKGVVRSKEGHVPIYEGGGNRIDLERLTPTDIQRADLLYDVIADAGGSMSQYDMARAMGDLMDVEKSVTAQTVTSHALTVLYKQGRVEYTGQKDSTETTERRVSPIYRLREG